LELWPLFDDVAGSAHGPINDGKSKNGIFHEKSRIPRFT